MMEDPVLIKFLEGKRGETRRRVTRYLTLYVECHNLSPTELLNEAWQELRGETPPWMQKLPQRIEAYKDYLEGRGQSELTVKTAVTNIRSFYIAHGITPPRQKLKYKHTDTIERVVQSTDDLPGRDEIITAMNMANLKYRAIIGVMATSGMDASTTLSLNLQDLVNGLGEMAKLDVDKQLNIGETRGNVEENNEGIVEWTVSRLKLQREDKAIEYYKTYSTPEAVLHLLEYLEHYPPPQATSPLFRATHKGRRLPTRALHDYFRKLNTRCGWGNVGRQIYFRSHNLRKYFANQLQGSRMSQQDIDYLMNHKGMGRVHHTYFKPNPQELRRKYIENMDVLSLQEDIRVRTVTTDDLDMIHDLKRRVKELEELKQMRDLFDQLP